MLFFRSTLLVLAAATVHALHDPVCVSIANTISTDSAVFFPDDVTGNYAKDLNHWASSSSQLSKCSVEPGNIEDVGIILNILHANTTPFAVKGGGHTSNPGFSSTTGVHISMTRFNQVTYDSATETATIGTGLVWDDVYEVLNPMGVNVVGGRVTNVGVAGFTLGGGYSWKTNQFGLTVDTVMAFELVQPNGTAVNVTQQSDPELFFGLKGGFNNFGILTSFTLKTHPQGQVWGGLINYAPTAIPQLNEATAKFQATNTDPKASLIMNYNFVTVTPLISLILFYDGPVPPAGLYDDFLAIIPVTKDVSTRDFIDVVKSAPSDATKGTRGIFNSVSVTNYTPSFIQAVVNESIFWGARMSILDTGLFLSYAIEPFLPTALNHSGVLPSAYPPFSSRSLGLLPSNIYFSWVADPAKLLDLGLSLLDFDAQFHDAARQSAAQLQKVALAEGSAIAGSQIYPNYAIFDTPLSGMYGDNVGRLQALRARVDPGGVMAAAGGWKF
ncbi:FAD dependent oxidoreductase [Mycena floridula]|nr:FAD dependent oxidoreductase [Mycena floridula]